ncbi:hypothetical protein UY3_18764 [Chelonia mydas]|uniref:Uncharacterized protein n=1 Tax=Chelonia mydas TaxID=8469 RepID=M7B770_CHEMY|nr:hypothetical protein UY3_18764 [Chelonia mydas]
MLQRRYRGQYEVFSLRCRKSTSPGVGKFSCGPSAVNKQVRQLILTEAREGNVAWCTERHSWLFAGCSHPAIHRSCPWSEGPSCTAAAQSQREHLLSTRPQFPTCGFESLWTSDAQDELPLAEEDAG